MNRTGHFYISDRVGQRFVNDRQVFENNRRYKIIVNVLVRKVVISDKFSLVLEVKNAQVTFAEKIISFQKQEHLIRYLIRQSF